MTGYSASHFFCFAVLFDANIDINYSHVNTICTPQQSEVFKAFSLFLAQVLGLDPSLCSSWYASDAW